MDQFDERITRWCFMRINGYDLFALQIEMFSKSNQANKFKLFLANYQANKVVALAAKAAQCTCMHQTFTVATASSVHR